MLYVNILNSSPSPVFLRQIDKKKTSDFITFCENSNEDRVWDYVVVYEEIKSAKKIKVKEGGLIFFSGESEDSRFYGKKFLRQFSKVITSHSCIKATNHIQSQTSLNWHFGFSFEKKKPTFDYDALEKMPLPSKDKNISVITSSLCLMPGHACRLSFINELKKRYSGKIDFFGKGIRFIDDKAEAILPYRFHICLENSQKPHYWTEKIADPLLGFSVPIYFGDPLIESYLPSNAIYKIDVNNPQQAFEIIDNILENPENAYAKRLSYLIEARNKILNDYNFINVFIEYIKNETFKTSQKTTELTLYPCTHFWDMKIGFFFLRMKRFIYKKYAKTFLKL